MSNYGLQNQQSIADEIAFEDDIQDELIENQLPLCTIYTILYYINLQLEINF